QAFGRTGYEEDRFDTESAQSLETGIQTSRTTAAINKAIAVITATGTAGTVLIGAWLVRNGRISPGDLLIFVAYVGSLYKPVRDLGRLSGRFSRAAISAQRIAAVLAIEPDIHDHPDAVVASNLRGEIAFRNVSFSYADSTNVLRHVSFRIAPGQRVALVGGSGAGKSTIVSLLLRLYEPQDGAILIDGLNIERYRRESLRQEIGLVLQDTVLFGVSIRENIAYGKPDATPAEIEEAARQAHAHEVITSLSAGYDTALGDRRATLSGGQRQRICLARALIKRPAILVLDEPTSAIDPLSASLIEDAIGRSQHGRTTLVIAHRFGSMSQFDQILVLKDGAIVECGHHDRLMASRGHYAELAGARWACPRHYSSTASIPSAWATWSDRSRSLPGSRSISGWCFSMGAHCPGGRRRRRVSSSLPSRRLAWIPMDMASSAATAAAVSIECSRSVGGRSSRPWRPCGRASCSSSCSHSDAGRSRTNSSRSPTY